MDIVHKIFFLYMNSVSGLCLCLRDTALNFNLPFDLCRWLVEGEDVEVIRATVGVMNQQNL